MAIQFDYCFLIIGLYIDIDEYGMLSMGFDCCLEEIKYNVSVDDPKIKIIVDVSSVKFNLCQNQKRFAVL